MVNFDRSTMAVDILHDLGIQFESQGFFEKMARWRRACSTWNLAAKLMSSKDLAGRFDEHVADSLGLVPYVSRAMEWVNTYHDIGSGAGFPAIPVVATLGSMKAVLWERDSKKAAFLRFATKELGFSGVLVNERNLEPGACGGELSAYTARALERPRSVTSMLLPGIEAGGVFFDQRPPGMPTWPDGIGSVAVEDAFSRESLRRGSLRLVGRHEVLARFHVEPPPDR